MDISVIICTYNPDDRIFLRCLKAVQSQQLLSLQVECIIVDNNSIYPIAERSYVKEFLENFPNARCITETKQGLTYSRLCGYRASSAEIIVFFDDDNEPASDYLITLSNAFSANKTIGAIGPGIVKVDYIDGSNSYLEECKGIFQEYGLEEDRFGNDTSGYEAYYPYGTGLSIRREAFELYTNFLEENSKFITDRTGNSLASGGDIQIVWVCVKNGFLAGRLKKLLISHLINGHKANEAYIRKLVFGCAKSYQPARILVFPDEKNKLSHTVESFRLRKIAKQIIKFRNPYRIHKIAELLGSVVGHYEALDRKVPLFYRTLIAYFKLK